MIQITPDNQVAAGMLAYQTSQFEPKAAETPKVETPKEQPKVEVKASCCNKLKSFYATNKKVVNGLGIAIVVFGIYKIVAK